MNINENRVTKIIIMINTVAFININKIPCNKYKILTSPFYK